MRKFTTTYYQVSSNGKFPPGKGFRLAFISDFHNMEFGSENVALKKAVDKEKPDLVLIGGDQIVAKPEESLDPGLFFAERLAEDYRVFYGCGNHEYRLKLYPEQYGDLYKKFRERLKKAEICYLENETADLTVNDCPLRIYGYAMDRTYYDRFYRGSLPVSELMDHLGKVDPARYGILLAHHPIYRASYAAYGADLTLSGHYHGGVVGLGAHRGLVTPDFRLFSNSCRGIFRMGNNCQIISAGTGEHTIPVRIWNKRELIIVDIGQR
ncbi:metallophosphoesterase [Fusicatenibacter sp.]